jgi:methylmalonyl-CoA/ethylmalonyl-CoA epimerase
MIEGKKKARTGFAPSIAELGEVAQIAFVVKDFEATIDHWIKVFGAGPFFTLPHVDLSKTLYRGAPTSIDMSAAIGFWKDIHVEIIHQHNDAPSIYKEWTDNNGAGIHHIGVTVTDLNTAHDILAAAGGVIVQDMEIAGTARAFYMDLPGSGNTIIELMHWTAEFSHLFDQMHQATIGWDGKTDPVRLASSLYTQ